ncbi:hypothetical protein VHEMI03440 [[Torrubiella] hemipterigena]|uniref:mannan endo-1,6-alpha-mannosidase n=1 Tax=[Torrubiella] hemipterigena TaxID=1531966 RepID=A0A0A1TDE3_9HYPO|nr:hypothetical protein VHEMI03440 [[Torrubiella] hemipterigena]
MRLTLLAQSLGMAAALAPKDLDPESQKSIRNVAATIAHGTMSYYNGNATSNAVDVGNVQKPYYWWVAGGLWGVMLDYYRYTKDPSYNDALLQALLAKVNLGPENNYMPPEHALEEGNDDLFFWGSAVLSAAEHNFPQPQGNLPSWLDMAKNVFDQLQSRWDTKHCGGGIFWQIRADNPNGLTYKNSISNGGYFQLAARLARATGDDKYLQTAQEVWDWMWKLNWIDNRNYHIYDGAGIDSDCTKTNPQSYTYTHGIIMYGAAILAEHTGKSEWADRTEKLLDGASWFFWNQDSGGQKGVLYEASCEAVDRCWLANADMTTFKGFFSQFMWKTAILLPNLRDKVEQYMLPTTKAASQSCTGGSTGTACGERWYTEKFEGKTGLGPQMCALATIQGLLADENDKPFKASDIKRNSDATFKAMDPNRPDPVTSSAAPPPPSTTSTPPPPPPSTTEAPPSTTSSTESTTTSAEPSTSSSTSESSSVDIPPTTSSTPSSSTFATTTSSELLLSSTTTNSNDETKAPPPPASSAPSRPPEAAAGIALTTNIWTLTTVSFGTIIAIWSLA